MKLPGISQPNSAWSRRRFLCALSAAGVGQVLHSNLLRATGPPTTIFSDVTADAGITWRQFNGFSPDRYLIETMGGGVGMFDFDNDEKLDIFLLNGGETPRGKSAKPLQNALYRNLGNGKFAEVAAEAGLHRVHNYGMGVAVADFDNDGHQDIFTTGFPNCTTMKKAHPDGIDFLINNAGVAMNGFDNNVVKTTLGCNYYGTLAMTQKMLPQIHDGGRLVRRGSITIAMDFSILSSATTRSFHSRVLPRSVSPTVFERTASKLRTRACL